MPNPHGKHQEKTWNTHQIRWFISQGSPGMSLSNGEYPQNLHVFHGRKWCETHEIWGDFFGVPPWFLGTWQPWESPPILPVPALRLINGQFTGQCHLHGPHKKSAETDQGIRGRFSLSNQGSKFSASSVSTWKLTHGATGSKLKTWDEAEVALAPRDLDSFSKSQYPKKTTEVGFFAFGHRLQPCHPC